MRRWVIGVLLAVLASGSVAQEPSLSGGSIVTLDQDRLFSESQFGRSVLARIEAEEAALAAENRKLEAAFEAEERTLTDLRTRLSAPEFRKLADEFDLRVEDVRRAQDARFRALTRRRDEDRTKFFDSALPVLGQLMAEKGAVAIIDRSVIVLGFGRLDITDDAIARLDVELGDGLQEAAPDQPDPAPEPVAPPGAVPAPATP